MRASCSPGRSLDGGDSAAEAAAQKAAGVYSPDDYDPEVDFAVSDQSDSSDDEVGGARRQHGLS